MQIPQNFINKSVVVYNTRCNLGATRHLNQCQFTILFAQQAIVGGICQKNYKWNFFVKSVFQLIFNDNTSNVNFLFCQRKHFFFLQSNKHSQRRIPLRNQQNSYLTLPFSLNSSGLVTVFIFLHLSSFELAAENVMVLTSGTSSLNLLVAFSLQLNNSNNFLICFHYCSIFLHFVSVSNLCSIFIKGTTII